MTITDVKPEDIPALMRKHTKGSVHWYPDGRIFVNIKE